MAGESPGVCVCIDVACVCARMYVGVGVCACAHACVGVCVCVAGRSGVSVGGEARFWASEGKSGGSGSHRAIVLALRRLNVWSARWRVPSDRGTGGNDGVPSSWVAGVLTGMGD